MKRNLLYSCCALAHSDEWRKNVEYLCRYPEAFNARRIVLIKTGPGIVPPDVVRREFAALGQCEFVEMPNDPILYESSGFLDGLAMLESRSSDEATFFAHTKGVSYVDVPVSQMRGVRRWRNRMYQELLSDTRRVEEALREFDCVGCFRISGYMPNLATGSSWHFAGTFWWFRHDAVFSHSQWARLDDVTVSRRWAVESYLGGLFPIERSACLHGEHPGNLYNAVSGFQCACGHYFQAELSMRGNPVKVCPKCFKRRARLVEDE